MRQIDVLGLDIGSSTVKIVQLRREGTGWAVAAAGITDIADRDAPDEAINEMHVSQAVRRCLRQSGAETNMAVCSVAGPEVAVRNFNFPALPKEEIEGAIMLEASQICPFNLDDCALTWQLRPNGKETLTGVLVAATKKLVEKKRQLVRTSSLEAVLMDVDGLALLNCFTETEKPEKDRAAAVLNLGGSCANLAIIGGDALPFVRDIAFSPAGMPKEPPEGFHAAVVALAADVNDTLRYFAARGRNNVIEKVLVCGGFALADGVVDMLDAQLAARAVLWNPFEKMRFYAGRADYQSMEGKGPALAVAAGLAMRTV